MHLVFYEDSELNPFPYVVDGWNWSWEISASVGGFAVDFGGQCRLLPDDQNIQDSDRTAWFYFHSELDGKP
jgi:hypothetical protein